MAVAYNEKTGEALRLDDAGQWVPTKIAKNPQTGEHLAMDGDSWKPVKVSETFAQSLESPRRDAVLRGMSFGLSDEIGAAAGALGGAAGNLIMGKPADLGGEYDSALADKRASAERFVNESPIQAAALEIGGGLTTGGAGAVKVMGAQALKTVPSVAKLAGVGAATGAASGFGNAEGGIEERVAGAATGGLVGGVLGAGVPMAAKAAGSALKTIAQPVMDRIGSGPASAVDRKLLEAIQRDGKTPQQVAARLKTMGPQASIMDAGGENVIGLADTIGNQPGPGRAIISRFLNSRQAGQADRIGAAARKGLDAEGDIYQTADDLMKKRATDAAPLYEKAFAQKPISDDRVQQLIAHPDLQTGINRGMKIIRREALARNEPFDPTNFAITGFNEAGDPIVGKVPNMRLLDAAKRGLDDMLEDYRDSTTGKIKWTQESRSIDELRRAYVDKLDSMNPDYAAARQAWAGPSQSLDAMARGRSFARGDVEMVERKIGDLSAGDKEFFREGVMREIQTMLDAGVDGADKARKLIRAPKMRSALEAVFPDKASFREFQKTLLQETHMAQSRARVTGNSATARRLAGQKDLGDDPGALAEAARGGLTSTVIGLARAGMKKLSQMPEAQAKELAQKLASSDPTANRNALAALVQRQQVKALSADKRNKLAAMFAAEIGQGAGRTVAPEGR